MLVAYGIRADGRRVLRDFRVATAESAAQGEAFLEALFRRGLQGTNLGLVVSDGCPDLAAVLAIAYAHAAHQRCWVHKLRNVAAKLPRRHQRACLGGLKRVSHAPTRREAGQACRAWAEQWRAGAPAAVRCVAQDLEALLAFYACPHAHWRMRRTTNAIERAFREVRRRTRPMSCFQNDARCERIISALMSRLNERSSRALAPVPTQAS